MPTTAVENLIVSSIHGAFIKYPEREGGPNLDYEWIAPDQSTHIAKAILLDLAANGYQIVKKAAPKSLEIYCADYSDPGSEHGAQKSRIRKPSGWVSLGL